MSTSDIIGMSFAIWLSLALYFVIGGIVCPDSLEQRWKRVVVCVLWPVYIAAHILFLPFRILIWMSKHPDDRECMENYNDYENEYY